MIYRPPSTSEQPEVTIIQWMVKQLPNGDRHLMGVIPNYGHDGRVTSKIMDYSGQTITTRSGRKYTLEGPPGDSLNAKYVWMMWCRHNAVDSDDAVDVTSEYEAKT